MLYCDATTSKGQSSIEFLTTYGFLFIILGVVISVLIFALSMPTAVLPSQCTSYSGPSCSALLFYTNTSKGYSVITMLISNGQSMPINVTSVTVIISSTKATGVCTPSLVQPGQEAVCEIPISSAARPGSFVQGFYSINATYCTLPISKIGSGCPSGSAPISYGGAFSATPSTRHEFIFAVTAYKSPTNQQMLPFQSQPFLPATYTNYTVMENGDWVTNGSYAYGTSGYVGAVYLGMRVVPFPQITQYLNNNYIACSYPYNSSLSIAYTTLYFPSGGSASFTIETDDAMAIYYKSSATPVWSNIFGSAWHGQRATAYGPNTITFSSGLSNFAVMWENNCSSGLQVLASSGLQS
ncbi:MAG: hypothetical protein QXR29_02570 [Candidatus Micrarchaeaceae archaeon]